MSRQISGIMDSEVDPCLDFNKYACGGFEKTSKLTNPSGSDSPDPSGTDLRKRVEKLLKIRKHKPNDFQTDKKVRDFYEACL